MRRKGLFLVGLAVAGALATAGPAQATITIGSNLNGTGAANMPGCNTPCTAVNLALPAGSQAPNGLTSTVNGSVTSWMAKANTGNNLALQVLRPTGGTTYTSLNTSSAVSFAGPGAGGPFATSQALKVGDTVGLRSPNGNLIFANTIGGSIGSWFLAPNGPLGDGTTRAADATGNNLEVLVQATIEPSSKLQFSNKVSTKKGKGRILMSVPNSGTLVYPTNGMSVTGPTTVGAAGDFQLSIKAAGGKKKKLNKKGKVGISPAITFTPTNGTAAVSSTKITLRKKKKK